MKARPEPGIAAPCGLYCDHCGQSANGEREPGTTCCEEQACPSALSGSDCEVFQCCVVERGLIDCAACGEFPCAPLLRFAHDSQHSERLPMILNLQRRRQFGRDHWLGQERAFWNITHHSCEWAQLRRDLSAKWRRVEDLREQISSITLEVELSRRFQEVDFAPQSVRRQAESG